MLESMFSAEEIFQEFGEVDIEIEADVNVIDEIFSIPRLTKLEIKFSIPNDDVMNETHQRVIERFQAQNIRKKDTTITSTHEDGIKADEETKAEMELALSNGSVSAVGYAGEERLEKSTRNMPLIGTYFYDSDTEPMLNAMLMSSVGLLRRITER